MSNRTVDSDTLRQGAGHLYVKKLFMRSGFVAAVCVGVAAFFGGQYWARYEAQRQAEVAMSWQSASQHAVALFMVRRALENLNAGKVADANVVLVRYAKLQAAGLEDCSKSPQCSAWVGSFMPSQVELSAVVNMKESQ